ncbi:hypothetical protein D3C87_1974830 [compost metagenome]
MLTGSHLIAPVSLMLAAVLLHLMKCAMATTAISISFSIAVPTGGQLIAMHHTMSIQVSKDLMLSIHKKALMNRYLLALAV